MPDGITSFLPKRIISLVPSQTELLFYLGLWDEIIGITKFCIHPADLCKNKTKIGGTKNFNFDIIDQLQPDLIIGNKEENYQEGIERLQEKYRVWISDIFNLADAMAMIQTIGNLVGRATQAMVVSHQIQEAFEQIRPAAEKRVAYFIWRKPYMAVGSNTFIDDILSHCGFSNVFSALSRYPEVSKEMLAHAEPEYIFLASEPYPFKEKHLAEFQGICPAAKIRIVDGEMFSWYGSRLLQSAPYFQNLIHQLQESL
jgi:ABC-type Fe3+-hydroxamate transport system substrate-binding protein